MIDLEKLREKLISIAVIIYTCSLLYVAAGINCVP
jgi:hypothetical protein